MKKENENDGLFTTLISCIIGVSIIALFADFAITFGERTALTVVLMAGTGVPFLISSMRRK